MVLVITTVILTTGFAILGLVLEYGIFKQTKMEKEIRK